MNKCKNCYYWSDFEAYQAPDYMVSRCLNRNSPSNFDHTTENFSCNWFEKSKQGKTIEHDYETI